MTADPLLKRLEINALLWCLAVTALAWFATNSRALALGVLGGGALSAISILAIRTSVETLIALLPPTQAEAQAAAAERVNAAPQESDAPPVPAAATARRAASRAVIKLVGRYALLGLMAYAMIARLRLHPIGLLIGASSLVASASLEAFRVVTRPRRV
jgi:type VI protein secretion system component VasK